MRKIKSLENKLKAKYYRDYSVFFTKEKKNLFDNNFLHTYGYNKANMAINLQDSVNYVNDSGFNTYKLLYNVIDTNDIDHFKYSRYEYSNEMNNVYKDSDNTDLYLLKYKNNKSSSEYNLYPEVLSNIMTEDTEISTFINNKMTLGDDTVLTTIQTNINNYIQNISRAGSDKELKLMSSPYPDNVDLKNADAEITKKALFYSHNDTNYKFYGFTDASYVKYGDYINEELGKAERWVVPGDDQLHTLDNSLSTNKLINYNNISSLLGNTFSIYMNIFGSLQNFNSTNLSIGRESIIDNKNIAKVPIEELKKVLIKVKDQDKYYLLNENFVADIGNDIDKLCKFISVMYGNDDISTALSKLKLNWLIPGESYKYIDPYSTIDETDVKVTSGKYRRYSLFDAMFGDDPDIKYLSTDEFLNRYRYDYKRKIMKDSSNSLYLWIPVDQSVWSSYY